MFLISCRRLRGWSQRSIATGSAQHRARANAQMTCTGTWRELGGTSSDGQRPAAKARIVLNHSTHVPGLLDALECFASDPNIKTLVPARLATVGKSNAEHLTVRVTTPTAQGWKLLARKGTQVQEVFAVCAPGITQEDLQRSVDERMPRTRRHKERQPGARSVPSSPPSQGTQLE